MTGKAAISRAAIDSFTAQLDNHPVYAAVDSVDALRLFMEHHIYSVWDFMSLVKFLQSQIAPAGAPWWRGRTSRASTG